jgi:cytochrome c-type biogenesis protein CcmH
MVIATFAAAAAVLCAAVLAPLLLTRGARRTGAMLALALPALAIGVYALVGTPAALDPVNVEVPTTLEDAIVQLERRLADEPASVEGWVLLGRSRMAQERFADARDAFAKAHALLPDEPDLAVEYADAQMRAASDGRFPDAATALLEGVVARDPRHQRALFYLGAQRFQAGQPAEAAALWERLLPLVPPATAAALRPQLDAARAQAGLPPLPADAPAAVEGPSIEVTVDLAPDVAAKLPAGATLFVFARPVGGAGPPVAAARVAIEGFPVAVTLTDADSVMPTAKLSAQAEVEVSARVSASGDATAVAGDLEAAPRVIAVGDGAKIALSLDRTRE